MVQLKKVTPIALREVGVDERWLQEQIEGDPSLLGLGPLEIVSREHRQPVGGKIDFLMRDVDDQAFYEVEVMLGPLDESHIIRTIEYWDVERQRRPQFDHYQVIVSENITSRFFNVLRLLNRAVPMIAVQLSSFRLDDEEIVVHAVTVLDVSEEIEEEVDPVERADRAYWERKNVPNFLLVVDTIIAALRAAGLEPRLTYNRSHIALGTTGYNFCWFHPRLQTSNCQVISRLRGDLRDEAVQKLQAGGIDASPNRIDRINFSVRANSLEAQKPAIVSMLKQAEEWSNR